MNTSRQTITSHLNSLLNIDTIKDCSCNGLQCEGKEDIKKIGLAVDACIKVYEQAVEKNCDMVVAHHGIIWGGLTSITGAVYKQLSFLIENKLNLYAAHLPLDLHAEYGNNIQLAKMVDLEDIQAFGNYDGVDIGYMGKLKTPLSNKEISEKYQKITGGKPFDLSFGKEENETVAIVSGGGSKTLPEAIEKNIDCFVTGESNHQDHHIALEGSINVLYLGHYHSEQNGVIALGKHLEEKFGVETVFLDEPTLV